MISNFCTGVLALLISASLLQAEEKVIFEDNFDRENAEKVGKDWKTETANGAEAKLEDKAALFITTDEDYQPAISHKFTEQSKGKFTVSFVKDWLRDYETDWGFFMQLGSSKSMTAKDGEINKGVAVNLVWGGGFSINTDDIAVFGQVKGDSVKKLAITSHLQDL